MRNHRNMNVPLLLINTDYQDGSPDMVQISANYIDALQDAGAAVACVPSTSRERDMAAFLEIADGVVLIGGKDYDPGLWGEPRHKTTMLISIRRQIFDLAFARFALEEELPVLGICGGHQLINIVSGGTLYTSIEDQVDGALTHWPKEMSSPVYHPVTIDRTGSLFTGFEKDTLQTNSFHHQSIKKLGNGLRVTATAPDGVIEGIEKDDSPVFGVQWHPEKDKEDTVSKHLFTRFVDICRFQEKRKSS